MSLEDSLSAASARVERVEREKEREENVMRECRAALKRMIAGTVREAAEGVYASLCDCIADEIYAGLGSAARRCAEGYMELPERLQLPAETARILRAYRKAADDLQLPDAEPHLEAGGGCGVRLTEIKRKELFWGYRNYLSLTEYGAAFAGELRRRARADGIEMALGAVESGDGCEARFREMSRNRCMIGRADAVCRLALRYRYDQTKLTDGAR